MEEIPDFIVILVFSKKLSFSSSFINVLKKLQMSISSFSSCFIFVSQYVYRDFYSTFRPFSKILSFVLSLFYCTLLSRSCTARIRCCWQANKGWWADGLRPPLSSPNPIKKFLNSSIAVLIAAYRSGHPHTHGCAENLMESWFKERLEDSCLEILSPLGWLRSTIMFPLFLLSRDTTSLLWSIHQLHIMWQWYCFVFRFHQVRS